MDYAKLLEQDPYSMDRREKTRVMTEGLLELTEHHRSRCEDYRRIVDGLGYDPKNIRDYYDIPMMPVRLFKERELKSINDDQIFKTMTSSGTTGQQVSKIFLDEQTAANQQLTLAKIVGSYTGKSRLPMIIIDCPSVIRNRAMFSARGAGILGFSIFGSRRIYALDDDMNLNIDGIREFLEKHKGERILLFGFTFMIWRWICPMAFSSTAAAGRSCRTRRCPRKSSRRVCGRCAASPQCWITMAWWSRPAVFIWSASAGICTPAISLM